MLTGVRRPSTCLNIGQSFRLRSQAISFVLHYCALISSIPRYFAFVLYKKITYCRFVSTSIIQGCVVFALFISLTICYVFLTREPRPEIDYCCLRWVFLYTRLLPSDIHDMFVFNCIQNISIHVLDLWTALYWAAPNIISKSNAVTQFPLLD